MKKTERVRTTLEHKEPDILPATELSVDITILETIVGKSFEGGASFQTQVSGDRSVEASRREMEIICAEKFFDMICVDLSAPDGFEAKKNPDGTKVDELGRILAYDEGAKAWTPLGSQSIFVKPEDVEEFNFPDPHVPGRTFGLEYVKKRVGDTMAIATFIRDPFAHAWEVFGPVNFVRWMYEEPRAIRKMFEETTRFNVELIKRVGELGVDLVVSGGDYAEARGPIVKPRFFDQMVFPYLKQQVEAAHSVDVKFVKHTDGNIETLLEGLSKIVDGVHSLDPSAGMDIGDVKREYGDRLLLMGNVSVDNLARKSREEVIDETRRCISNASPGGGHILSSSNSWYAGCKPENCLAMIEACSKYGRYPIRI